MRRISIMLGGALVALAITAPAATASPVASKAATQCPGTFRVLHNDRIGPAVLPQGQYVITVLNAGLQCGQASKLFTRFLSDYDGKLGGGWTVVAQGNGKAQFNLKGVAGFRVQRSKGGGNTPSTYGTVCPGNFQVLNDDTIGPLLFPKGAYRVVIPPGSIIQCAAAFKLFKQFLNSPDGVLPKNWRMKPTSALFYKPGNAKRKKFRVDPAT